MSMDFLKVFSLKFIPFLLACSLFASSCSIQPVTWQPPAKPAFTGKLSLNDKLVKATKIDLNGWYGPEEFAFDEAGNIYCGVHRGEQDFTKGAILKITRDGTVEEYLHTDAWVTGMQFDKMGNLIALIQNVGLVSINPNKEITTLVSKDTEGRPIKMGSGLKIAKDGKIYFANLSSKNTTSAKYINQLFLELKPTGGVFCYDPTTKYLTSLSNGNYFANGLALSKDEDFLLVSETSKYRILKYWLKGEKVGTPEVFLDNLAGFPNNITLRENGNFWVGFSTKRNDQLDKIHPKKRIKQLVYSLPSFVQPKVEKFGMVLEISETGNIVQALFDSKGEIVIEAGAVKENQNYLYLGGDIVSYIARYELPTKAEQKSANHTL